MCILYAVGPIITLHLENAVALDQEMAVFSCAATGQPTPNIFFKNSQLPVHPITTCPPSVVEGVEVECTLKFQAMLDHNQTTVECVASNVAGMVSSTATLFIAGRIISCF